MAKKSSAQIWVEYAAVRAVVGFLRLLPRTATRFVGMSLGRLAFHLLGRLRRIGLRNLELAFPERTQAERKQILQGTFRNLGRMMADFSDFDEMTVEDLKSLVEYQPDLKFAAD